MASMIFPDKDVPLNCAFIIFHLHPTLVLLTIIDRLMFPGAVGAFAFFSGSNFFSLNAANGKIVAAKCK